MTEHGLTEHVRFWSKVDKNGPLASPLLGHCWIWLGGQTMKGYGVFKARLNGKFKTVQAHRYALILSNIEMPVGTELDHLCRKRPCVNPLHVESVTHRVNIMRGIGKAAHYAVASECIYGHAFDKKNTIVTKTGKRRCRTCKNRAHREYKAQRRKNARAIPI